MNYLKEIFRQLKLNKQLVLGLILVSLGLIILILNYSQIVWLEVGYAWKNSFAPKVVQSNAETAPVPPPVPADSAFTIIIPKLDIKTKVIPQVNPYDPEQYRQALSQGVAHAQGTALPDQDGNVFIFAHSTASIVDVNRYNAVFYLLNKLEAEDDVYLFFQNQIYHYEVVEKKIISPKEIKYLKNYRPEQTVTLMTCWPAGTTLKRLLIIGRLLSS